MEVQWKTKKLDNQSNSWGWDEDPVGKNIEPQKNQIGWAEEPAGGNIKP